jgi:hypothetical protein
MAKAKSVNTTRRRTASKNKPKLSAVWRVRKSGYDLVPSGKRRGKSAKLHQYANIKWKRWRRPPPM